MIAHYNRVRISPKKANVVAGMIRGRSAVEALDILRFTPNKPAKHLRKALLSAVSNAENNGGADRNNLVIKIVTVDKGAFYKRYLPSTRGRVLPLKKPTSNITIELSQK